MAIKINNDSHAAWECKNSFLRHLSDENANLNIDQNFVVADFGGLWVVKKLLKWRNQYDFVFLENFKKLWKIGKNQNVVKTNGGNQILKRKSYNNKPHHLGADRFPWVRMRFMSKSSQDSNERGWRRYKGLNNNILLEEATFNTGPRTGLLGQEMETKFV